MKRILLCMGMAGLSMGVPAATVERLVARQMWPWATHFEISYVLRTSASEACDVSLRVTAGGESVSVPAERLLGETRGLTSGAHCLVWDSSASGAPTAAWLKAHSGELRFDVETSPSANAAEYLVIDLSGGAAAAKWPARRVIGKPEGGWSDAYKTTKLVLRRICCGGRGDAFSSDAGVTFSFGKPADDTATTSWDFAAVTAALTNDYYIGVFELTQKQYQLITGTAVAQAKNAFRDDPLYPQGNLQYYEHMRGKAKGARWPVSSDVDETSLMGLLRAKVDLTATAIPSEWQFDLPTEAQWEYACRAGTTGPWNSGEGYDPYTSAAGVAGDRNLDLVSWNPAIPNLSGGRAVGLKVPNAWGLYDMHGNASEYCLDYNVGPGSAVGDRTMPESLGYRPNDTSLTASAPRVLKGGAYSSFWTSVAEEKLWVGHRSCSHVKTYSGGAGEGHHTCRVALRNSAANAGK